MTSSGKGLIRLAIAGGASVALVCLPIVFQEPLHAALAWVELWAPKPGLSGLALLLLSPVAFLLFLATVEWVLNGFGLSFQSSDSK